MKPGPKPRAEKKCGLCGIVKPRSEFYKKLETISHKCKECTRIDLKQRAPRYFGKYREYANAWRRDKYKTDLAYKTKVDALHHTRRRDARQAMPPWADKAAIAEFYAKRPEGMEVDHIIPLRGIIDGRRVCGLHILANLQYLSKSENGKKKNRITEADIANL